MRKEITLLLIFLFLSTTSCQNNNEVQELTKINQEEVQENTQENIQQSLEENLDENMSGLYGLVMNKDGTPLANEVARLGEVIWNEDRSEGNFVIDGAWSPSTITDENGFFSFINIKPGEYVIVVRDINTNPIIVPDPENSNEAAIYLTKPNEMINIGAIVIDPDQ